MTSWTSSRSPILRCSTNLLLLLITLLILRYPLQLRISHPITNSFCWSLIAMPGALHDFFISNSVTRAKWQHIEDSYPIIKISQHFEIQLLSIRNERFCVLSLRRQFQNILSIKADLVLIRGNFSASANQHSFYSKTKFHLSGSDLSLITVFSSYLADQKSTPTTQNVRTTLLESLCHYQISM